MLTLEMLSLYTVFIIFRLLIPSGISALNFNQKRPTPQNNFVYEGIYESLTLVDQGDKYTTNKFSCKSD